MLGYILHPIALMTMPPTRAESTLSVLTMEEERALSPAVREYLERSERALAALGFGAPFRACHRAHANLRSTVSLLEHPRDGALGFLLAAESTSTGRVTTTASYRSDFRDGMQLHTSNLRTIGRTPTRPIVLGIRLPDVQDAAALYEIHRFRVQERSRTSRPRPLSRGADPIAFQDREQREVRAFWIARGYYRRVNGGALAMTAWGAIRAAYRGLFPWKQITESRERREAAEVSRRYRASGTRRYAA